MTGICAVYDCDFKGELVTESIFKDSMIKLVSKELNHFFQFVQGHTA